MICERRGENKFSLSVLIYRFMNDMSVFNFSGIHGFVRDGYELQQLLLRLPSPQHRQQQSVVGRCHTGRHAKRFVHLLNF